VSNKLETRSLLQIVRLPSSGVVHVVELHCFYRNSAEDEVQGSPPISPLSGTPHPIHNLPVEILQRIFTCCAEPRPPDAPSLKVEPEWIAITYVCQYWRAVALNHHSLWGSITPNLSPAWFKVLMTRSEPAPVDADLRVGQTTVKRICLCVDEVIDLLFGCTRLRSLRLVGPRRDVCAVLDALRSSTPIHSLALSLWEPGPPVLLPENLFGGQAPIRCIHFTANRCIVAPRWLLHGVTRFTSGEQILLPDLLDALRQMPALTHFTLQHCRAHWEESDAPLGPPIHMPYLTNLAVHADSPRFFAMLNQRLALPQSSKRLLVLRTLAIAGWDRWAHWFAFLLPIIEAANGLQHAFLTGGAKEGTFRTWTGDAMTIYEDAEFCFEMYWYGSPASKDTNYMNVTSPIFHLDTLCDLLGVAKRGRRLILEGDPGRSELPATWWWALLEKLPAVEELELHPHAVKSLYSAWDVVGAPAVLPALWRVQFVQIEALVSRIAVMSVAEVPTYMATTRKGFISRIVPSKLARPDAPARTIAWVPSSCGTCDAIPSMVQSPTIHAEPTSEGLMRLLQGDIGQGRA
jgi:F-box-like